MSRKRPASSKPLKSHRFEPVYLVTLFTGMRRGEVLGLTWDCVDFGAGSITVNKQLQSDTKDGRKYDLVSIKNSKGCVIAPAPDVMKLLKEQRRRQKALKLQMPDPERDPASA